MNVHYFLLYYSVLGADPVVGFVSFFAIDRCWRVALCAVRIEQKRIPSRQKRSSQFAYTANVSFRYACCGCMRALRTTRFGLSLSNFVHIVLCSLRVRQIYTVSEIVRHVKTDCIVKHGYFTFQQVNVSRGLTFVLFKRNINCIRKS